MKQRILEQIYDTFTDWCAGSREFVPVCRQGCSTCCTQNVTITALEGEKILRYIVASGRLEWFADQLSADRLNPTRPVLTTNDFAKACLEEKDVDDNGCASAARCPFLEEDTCTVYPVRPFGCRFFASSSRCSSEVCATVPDYYLAAGTAVSQLIEHLGQNEYWGNMIDVLFALLDISEFKVLAEKLDKSELVARRMHILTAKPLPGFLIGEEEGAQVIPLLEKIFNTEVDGRRIEDILNGR
ncbi:YkgJ family cysteine cluster protein [Desulforhopalus singaporensis]|uniref:Putative zinc-or iron-chelating domain-containing protein n=1 Tax=Desulforhopalus singaporensis TaxID=91360 RepID=A0A1H0KRS4_9BACT|nr:YkgJ family cysteine cluster protein [Desulforhopalus singaporensis]SDO58657.1 Putative zinc-or iron-chelating domain-containing protein [Desulforhopalus singaporensis]